MDEVVSVDVTLVYRVKTTLASPDHKVFTVWIFKEFSEIRNSNDALSDTSYIMGSSLCRYNLHAGCGVYLWPVAYLGGGPRCDAPLWPDHENFFTGDFI